MNRALIDWAERLAPRERRLLSAGALVVVAAAVYALLWEPAAQGIRKLQTDLPQRRAQDAELRAMADEAARLRAAGRQATAIPPADRPAAVRRSLERAGLWRDGGSAAASRDDPAARNAARGAVVSTLTVAGTTTVASAPSTRTSPPEVLAEGNDRVRVRFDDIDYGVWVAWLATTEGELAAHASRVSVVALAPKGPVGHVRTDVLLDWSQPAGSAGSTSSATSS